MTRSSTRRDALRTVGALSTAAVLAGCGWDDGASTATPDATPSATPPPTEAGGEPQPGSDEIPGVEDGVVASARDLSIAHEDTLQDRSGRLVKTTVETNRETGESIRTGVSRVDVDGERVLAVAVGERLLIGGTDARREVYAEADDLYVRTLVDDEWDAHRVDPGSGGLHVGDLTGRTRLESLLLDVPVVGRDPDVDGQYVLRRTGSGDESSSDDQDDIATEWFRVHATVDEHGLCHDWGQLVDEVRSGTRQRYSFEARVEGLLETTVTRPVWVDEIGE